MSVLLGGVLVGGGRIGQSLANTTYDTQADWDTGTLVDANTAWRPGSVVLFEDFGTDPSWTQTGTLVTYDGTGKRIDVNAIARNSGDQRLSYNYVKGSGNFHYSFDFRITANTGNSIFSINVGSDHNPQSSSGQVIFLFFIPGGGDKIYLDERDGANLYTLQSSTWQAVTGTTYHVHLQRSGNTVTATVYDDKDHTTTLQTLTGTLTNTTAARDYISVSNYSDAASSSTISGYVDEIIDMDAGNATNGTWTSPVIDTGTNNNSASQISWTEVLPTANEDITWGHRASNTNPPTGAYTALTGGSPITSGFVDTGRYHQIQATLTTVASSVNTPSLDSATFRYTT